MKLYTSIIILPVASCILQLLLILPVITAVAQYSGGNGDGNVYAGSGDTSLNNHSIYCKGGKGEGFHVKPGAVKPFNIQLHYCSGGVADGQFMQSFQLLFNFQSFYCKGSMGDGFNFMHTGPVNFNDQLFYCSGGSGDGIDDADIHTQFNDQLFYCSGKKGDGFDKAGQSIILNDQSFYCLGGVGDGFHTKTSNANPLILQDHYCSGGIADGLSFLDIVSILNDPVFYCMGSAGDGFNLQRSRSDGINDQFIYCSGGFGDGYDKKNHSGRMNNHLLYCQGGTGDGFVFHYDYSTIHKQDYYCRGGYGDGFHKQTTLNTLFNDHTSYCSGGSGDGFIYDVDKKTINDQNLYCVGGLADGFNMFSFSGDIPGLRLYCSGGIGDGAEWASICHAMFNDQDFYCAGGNNDGFSWNYSDPILFGYGIWTGIASSDWFTKSNWKHNTVPDISVGVVIPAGCLHYPSINRSFSINNNEGEIRCKKFNIQYGATFNSTSTLNIKGQMHVSGIYTNTSDSSLSQQINDGGVLTIDSSGLVRLGYQTSGMARTDLEVNSGGILSIAGGTLEIDDQLHVKADGELNISGGILFANKYGRGDDYSSGQPGALVILNGATANISGGSIKVCGKESVGKYHAVSIHDSDFLLSDSNILEIVNGDYSTHFDCGIYANDNVVFRNIRINKPGNIVFINSNLNIQNGLTIENGAEMKINSGVQVVVGN